MNRNSTAIGLTTILLLAALGGTAGAKVRAHLISYGSHAAPGVKAVAQGSIWPPSRARRDSGAKLASVRPSSIDAVALSTAAPTIVVSQVALHCLTTTGTSPSLGPRGTLMGLQCLSVPGLPTLPKKLAANRKRPKRPSVAPQVLAQLAVDKAIALAGKPGLHLSPARVGLTGLDTYFWVAPRPRPLTAQAAVPGMTVTAHARPVQYLWRFGDGGQIVTYGPGRPWTRRRPGSIAHQYQTRGRYAVSVQIIWMAEWRIGGGQWRSLGTFATTATRSFPVRQAVAVLVKP